MGRRNLISSHRIVRTSMNPGIFAKKPPRAPNDEPSQVPGEPSDSLNSMLLPAIGILLGVLLIIGLFLWYSKKQAAFSAKVKTSYIHKKPPVFIEPVSIEA